MSNAQRKRLVPLARNNALLLLATAYRKGGVVAHQKLKHGENVGDCCGTRLWQVAYALELTTVPPVSGFPTKTQLQKFFRSLGLLHRVAWDIAEAVIAANDDGEIEAAWKAAAKGLGLEWAEVLAAEKLGVDSTVGVSSKCVVA